MTPLILQDPEGETTMSKEVRGRGGGRVPPKSRLLILGEDTFPPGRGFALETRLCHPMRKLQTTRVALVPTRKSDSPVDLHA